MRDRTGRIVWALPVLCGVVLALCGCSKGPSGEQAAASVQLTGGKGLDYAFCLNIGGTEGQRVLLGEAIEQWKEAQREWKDAGGGPKGDQEVWKALPDELKAEAQTSWQSAQEAWSRAQDDLRKYYEYALEPGALLIVRLEFEEKSVEFFYVYRGTEKQPLIFSRDGFKVFLNGRPVFVDVSQEEAFAWLEGQPPRAVRSVRTVKLSGNAKTDIAALSHFEGSGVLIMMDNVPPVEARAELVKAIIAAKPTGLVIPTEMPEIEEALPQLDNLTHLVLKGPKLPDPAHLGKVTFLGHTFSGTEPASLAPLASLKQLQYLAVYAGGAELRDVSAIAELSSLHGLGLTGVSVGQEDLKAFTGLAGLRFLSLFLEEGDIGLRDVAPIADLHNLRELFLAPLPEKVENLEALARLKKLNVLVVSEEDLRTHKQELDAIRKALPECKIVGFCMGSAWMLAVLPGAAGSRRCRDHGVRRRDQRVVAEL